MANEKWSEQTEIITTNSRTRLCVIDNYGEAPTNKLVKPTDLGLITRDSPTFSGIVTIEQKIVSNTGYISVKPYTGGTIFDITEDPIDQTIGSSSFIVANKSIITSRIYGDFTGETLNNSIIIGSRGDGIKTEMKGDLVMLRTSEYTTGGTINHDVTLDQNGSFKTPSVSVNIRAMSSGNILLSDTVILGADNPSDPAILPKVSTCKGKIVTLICNADDLPFRVDAFAGDYILLSGNVSPLNTISIGVPYNSKTLISDGVSTWFQI